MEANWHGRRAVTKAGERLMERRRAFFTFDEQSYRDHGYCLYYFAPLDRAPGPMTQRHVEAIIDIASDGTLAGVELIDNMPPLVAPTSSDRNPRSPVPAPFMGEQAEAKREAAMQELASQAQELNMGYDSPFMGEK